MGEDGLKLAGTEFRFLSILQQEGFIAGRVQVIQATIGRMAFRGS